MTEPDRDWTTPVERLERRRYRKSDPRYTPEHDFRWRAAIRANPQSHFIYRWGVFLVGLTVITVGLLLVPLPGPGWLIVILGLLVWASEFDRAQWLLDFVRNHLRRWNTWVLTQSLFVRGFLGLLTALLVLAVLWVVFKYSGTLALLPDPLEGWMRTTLRL